MPGLRHGCQSQTTKELGWGELISAVIYHRLDEVMRLLHVEYEDADIVDNGKRMARPLRLETLVFL